ncbi:MAG: hypothetical protein ACKVP7_02120 [Hyphomicrobiaceae bacterium]
MLRALGRLVLVPLGLLLGTAAALVVLGSLGLEKMTHALHNKNMDFAALQELWSLVKDARGMATIGTLVPPLLLVVVGEVVRIRSSTYYIVGGGAALAALPLLIRSGTIGSDLSQIGLIWQVFATAGFVGGFVYWLIAGRNA